MAIDKTAREAYKAGKHKPSELYMDEKFFHSLRFLVGFEKDAIGRNDYQANMMSTNGVYYCSQLQVLLKNIAHDEARRG
jgi:hypothetical protein